MSLEAEEIPEVSISFEIEAVPTFIFIKNKQKIGRLDGAHAPELTKMVCIIQYTCSISKCNDFNKHFV